jgi:deoxyuridine 5'-triphosphate nucleotidohydrolase
MIDVYYKKLNEGAKVPFKAHYRDFGYDVVATSVEEVAPNVYKYGLGLAMEIANYDLNYRYGDEWSASIRLSPRSSIWKTGMVLSNSTGIIDVDYRGEISAVFYHVMPNMPKYEVGDRIGQIYIEYSERINLIEIDKLSETERGAGGYGSTGK